LDPDKYFYTEIYTLLAGDVNPTNDTSAVHSRTAMGVGDVVFLMDAQAACNDNQLLGVEFDGTYFYITGGNNAVDPNKVYVVDTAGTLIWSMNQPSHATGWGWRDLAWDGIATGTQIDTLWTSVNYNVDKFSIDLMTGALTYHGYITGSPQNPNRALAYKPDSGWFYSANFSSPCYKFNKSGLVVQQVANTLAHYGAAYDSNNDDVWWHSQDDGGYGFLCRLTQMDANSMAWGSYFGFPLPAGYTDGVAGGLSYWENFRGMNVLFALVQGTPTDFLAGLFLEYSVGVEEQPGGAASLAFGFAPVANPTKGQAAISYATAQPGVVSLKVYDRTGRLVETLVNTTQPAGQHTVTWNARHLARGVYFLRLENDHQTATHKLVLVD
jgi:hypothetical protein